MNNLMNFFQMLSQMKSNPMEIIGKRFNIPQNMNNPNDIIQHLMNTGQISQERYNQANNMVKQMQNNPQFQNMFNNKQS